MKRISSKPLEGRGTNINFQIELFSQRYIYSTNEEIGLKDLYS